MVGIVLAASGHFPYAEKYTGAMALGNLNFAILMRNELFGRFLYLIVNTCFAKVGTALVQPLFLFWCLSFISGPRYGGGWVARLFFRYGTLCLSRWSVTSQRIQHLGGIHSGCALSGVGWLMLKVVNNFRHHTLNHNSILVIGAITNIAVIVSAISAIPWVRNTHHK